MGIGPLTVDAFETAVVLLKLTSYVITQRRRLEKACGVPDEYGDDKTLLKNINAFLEKEIPSNYLEKALSLNPALKELVENAKAKGQP